jgi:cell division protein FtsB
MLQVMIRAGFTDSALDEEARQLVAAAEAVRVADHGTESVLLLAVQAELEEVSAARQQMEEEVQQLRDR